MTIELTVFNVLFFVAGIFLLGASALGGIAVFDTERFLRGTPLSLALTGAASLLVPFANSLAASAADWWIYPIAFFPWLLLLAAAWIERKSKDSSSHNKLLQLSPMDSASASLPQGEPAVNGAAEPGR